MDIIEVDLPALDGPYCDCPQECPEDEARIVALKRELHEAMRRVVELERRCAELERMIYGAGGW